MRAGRVSPGRSSSAPAPGGPPSLWPEMARESTSRGRGIRPAAWTASTWSRAPWAWQSAAASASGCSTPVSLLAAIRQTSAGGPGSIAAKALRSRVPSGRTGITSAPGPAAARTAGCSVAPTRIRRPWPRPWIARALASVPPLVKTTSPARMPKLWATLSRASSSRRRAARPWPCTAEGLPPASSAASTAARASGRSGSVALASR
jgi:hypothetical protein